MFKSFGNYHTIFCYRGIRDDDEVGGFFSGKFAATNYTHHQKSIICDAPCDQGKSRLVAYVGGLDVTDGRYDTPEFELFKSLLTEHDGDFYQKMVTSPVDPKQGPRQPWHDIHSKVEGKVAYDIFYNFYERWAYHHDSKGAPFEELQGILCLNFNGKLDIKPDQAWNCQFFRSITDDSAKFNDLKNSLKVSKSLNKTDMKF